MSINIYMFTTSPKIFAHKSAIETRNFVIPEYILNKGQDEVNLFHRFCPHRMYPLAVPGAHVDEINCEFHDFKWTSAGIPINNDRKLSCGKASVGRSGLIFKNFIEPNHIWVDNLAKETSLKYSHSMQGTSTGSWLWMMEIQADLLHIRSGKGAIHPLLSAETNLDEVDMNEGDGWVLQTCSTGWWLCIYPFTFIEWSKGCLAINYTIPKDKNNEFGFNWITQFYYDSSITEEKRKNFETLEDVFKEDVGAVEKQKGKWFPLISAVSRLEEHCIHFGKWVKSNN